MGTSIRVLDHRAVGTPMAVSLRSTRELVTGTWRTFHPRYVENSSPCALDCPAGTDVRRVLTLAAGGDIEAAWHEIRKCNPLPGVCGRVCYHPCERHCNRAHVDAAVAVHSIERAIADQARARRFAPPPIEPTDHPRLVAVVGSGPAGLSCAHQLARKGHHVTVFDAQPRPGGMLRYGIPPFRLPREILEGEIALLHQMGVRFVGRTSWQPGRTTCDDFDATFVAVGLQHSIPLQVPGRDLPGVRSGLEFLRDVNTKGGHRLSGPVIVIGGGNTALDTARSALRLGAAPTIVYRRDLEDMPAHPDEIAQAQAEGIPFLFRAAPARFIGVHGQLTEVEFQRMRPGPPDASGRSRPEPVPGAVFRLPAVLAMTATGEEVEREVLGDLLDPSSGRMKVDAWGRAGHGALFAGGDAATGAGTVVDAIGSGRRAAEAIQCFFDNRDPVETRAATRVGPEDMNFFYFTPTRAVSPVHLAAADACRSFDEVVGGLTWPSAQYEARRCASCGLCTHCDTCWTFCPDAAISKRPEGGYAIDGQHCKGCGVCVAECPRGAMVLEPEAGR